MAEPSYPLRVVANLEKQRIGWGGDSAQIIESYAAGSVTMPSSGANRLGGLVGAMDGGATITTSFSTDALGGAPDLGGL